MTISAYAKTMKFAKTTNLKAVKKVLTTTNSLSAPLLIFIRMECIDNGCKGQIILNKLMFYLQDDPSSACLCRV